MTNNEEKYTPEKELTRDGDLRLRVMYKSKKALYFGLAAGAVFCLTMLWPLVLMGVFILSLTGFVQYSIKDYIVVDIYDTNVIIYDLTNELARKVAYDDIVEWTCKHGTSSADTIMFKLKDGEYIYKDTFLFGKAYREFNKIMPKKESQAVRDVENSTKKLQFRNPFKRKDK